MYLRIFVVIPIFFSQTKAAKILWFGIVCLGFTGAAILISKSYKDWQENPIATSITTHPIADLEFPIVTVCPPRHTSTALYHDLVKAGNGTLSDENRRILKRTAYEIFKEHTYKEEGKRVLPSAMMSMGSLNGTVATPGFREQFKEEYYKEDREYVVVLQIPNEVKEKIGSGSITVELEIDTKEGEGWLENVIINIPSVTNYTRHDEEKSWGEAEVQCQKEGGHLASVTSEEADQAVRLGGLDKYWLGGIRRKGGREWSWADGSPWTYTWNRREGFGDRGAPVEERCVVFFEGVWYDDPCQNKMSYFCQEALRGRKTITMTYKKDQLTFSKFEVRYSYKAASQKLLESWEDKRMTGFRLNWKIEVENPPLIAKINKVGRSLRTPGLGDAFTRLSDTPSEQVYKAILTSPGDLLPLKENQSLVIELNVEKTQSDEVNVFTGFKLYKVKRTWFEAKDHCEAQGGHLASIHSQWEQSRAEQAAEGNPVWLAGKKTPGPVWYWEDNSAWKFENWKDEYILELRTSWGSKEEHLLMGSNGHWSGIFTFEENYYFLCQQDMTAA